MKSFKIAGFFLSLTFLLTLSSCGPKMPALPDDPISELEAIRSENGNLAGNEDSPSISPEENEQDQMSSVQQSPANAEQILGQYDYVDPTHLVPDRLLRPALLFYDKNKPTLANPNFLSVIDFSLSSTNKRFFIINMQTGAVWNIRVAHGKGSDANHDGYAESFSNSVGSNASSLGFYKTAETYHGKHGLSLRMDGLSTTNSKVRERAIVVHGASYVQDDTVIQGRSYGCPAVSMTNRDKVIGLIKGGSIIYAGK